MRLQVGGFETPCRAEIVDSHPSTSTGRQLQQVQVTFRVPEEQDTAEIDRGPLPEITLTGDDGSERRYRRTYGARTSSPSRTYATYSWTLEEVETLVCQALQIGDLTISPMAYKEDTSIEGRLEVLAIAVLDQKQFDEWRQLCADRGPASVVRHGICAQPRDMLALASIWAPEHDAYRCRINLIDDQPREKVRASTYEVFNVPALTAAQTNQRLTKLIDLLCARNLITGDDAHALNQDDMKATRLAHFDALKVRSFDDFSWADS